MDRRTTIKWVLAASAWPALAPRAFGAAPATAAAAAAGTTSAADAVGYGTDPDLSRHYHPGELWPLTFTMPQRHLAQVLSDLIIPADEHSPAAAAVGVVDFIDEWVSAPYPACQRDRPIVLEGFGWLDAESGHRFGRGFAALTTRERRAICDEIRDTGRARPERRAAADFFARYRDLTAGSFYSTAAGRKDLGYVGNVPLPRFEGPPAALLKRLGLP